MSSKSGAIPPGGLKPIPPGGMKPPPAGGGSQPNKHLLPVKKP